MVLYVLKPGDKLPEGTEYRVVCDREDLFGGCVIDTEAVLLLDKAPSKYPNGVDMLKGFDTGGKTWRTHTSLQTST